MVTGARRMLGATIKRQPINQQKRKCTRADPTQTGILLKNYDAEARPSAERLADMSQETNLPVDWIKKWFLRKRKTDGKNRTLPPNEPTFVENEPSASAHDGQALGHAHSKFWSMDAFVAADSTNFSPSVGHIPKFYGRRGRNTPPGNPDNQTTDQQGNEEERATLSLETSLEVTDYVYTTLLDPVLTRENVGPASYDLREILLGADAFAGYIPPCANEDAPGSPSSEHPNVTLTADDPGPTLLFPVAPSLEGSAYPDNTLGEGHSGSESAASLEFTPTHYPVSLISSPLDAIDDFILASGELGLISTILCSTSDGLELSAFESATGCLDSDLDSLTGFANIPNYMTTILGEPSVFYDSLLLQAERGAMGDSIDMTNCSGLLDIDVCLGAALMTPGHESESALGVSLGNLYDDMCDPTVSVSGFGGFDGGDDVREAAEGVDSDEGCWADAFDTMLV